jgi:hypothetical protein
MFLEGGWAMYPLSLLMCLGPPLSFVFLTVTFLSKNNFAWALSAMLFLFSILGPAFGVWAESNAMHQAAEAVETVSPLDYEVFMTAAKGESMAIRVLGISTAAIPLFFASILAGIGLSRLDRFQRVTDVDSGN